MVNKSSEKRSRKDNVSGNVNKEEEMAMRKKARIAGILYLLLIVFGISAQVIRMSFFVEGDATETASNIMENEMLYRVGFVLDLLMITSFLLLPLAFYKLLGSVNKNLSSLMVILVLVSVPIMFVNMIFYFAPILLLNDSGYLTSFTPDQLNSLVMLFFDVYTSGVWIATVFHGLWLLPLGILVYRSGYFPKVFGILLVLACFGFVIESFQHFLLPDLEVITYPGMLFEIIGEFGFCGYLLIMGIKKQ